MRTDVSVTVLGVKGNQVRLEITAPKNVAVHQDVIYARIHGSGAEATPDGDASNAPRAAKPVNGADTEEPCGTCRHQEQSRHLWHPGSQGDVLPGAERLNSCA